MRAAVLTAYGAPEGIEVQELSKPSAGADQVLVRIHHSTVTAGDAELRTFDVPWLFWIPLRLWLGVLGPRPNCVIGMEFSGVVEAVGQGVNAFAVGDAVYGMGDMGFGTCAEFAVVPAGGLVAKTPEGVSFEAVAPLPVGGLAALGYLRMGGIDMAKTVLIRGGSGSIGTYAVQLAKHQGAHVTAVCGPESVQKMHELGADVVLDYTQKDFEAHGGSYDLMLDVVGKMAPSRCLAMVREGGVYVRGTIPGLWEALHAFSTRFVGAKRFMLGDAGGSAADLAMLGKLVADGSLVSVVDRRYALDDIADAHRYVETGNKQGHVVINVV